MILMQITKNFNLNEFVRSSTATKYNIDNTPDSEVTDKIVSLVKDVLQPIRDKWQGAIQVTSGYRCSELNKKVNGAKNSDHLYGAAADIKCSNNHDLFNLILFMIKSNEIQVRQLIWEYGTKHQPQWIHISINHNKNTYKNNQVLYLYSK